MGGTQNQSLLELKNDLDAISLGEGVIAETDR